MGPLHELHTSAYSRAQVLRVRAQTGTNEYLVAGIFVPLPHENALPSLHANSGPPRFGLTEEESKL